MIFRLRIYFQSGDIMSYDFESHNEAAVHYNTILKHGHIKESGKDMVFLPPNTIKKAVITKISKK